MEPGVEFVLAQLVVILLSAKLFGELAERLGQPPVLGELLGGVALGLGVVRFFRPEAPILETLSELGVLLLMFQTGLRSDLGELLEVGSSSMAVAATGVALPFLAGWGAMTAFGRGGLPAVFVGAAMTATSVGITARVLSDLGKLRTREARIVLGAAVLDDVIGVILLAVVSGAAATGAFSVVLALRTTLLSAGFLGAALWLGPHMTRRLVALLSRMRVGGVLVASAVVFAFSAALLAHALGTALIVGAFTAGILLAGTERRVDVDAAIAPVADLFVPVFFVMTGARADLRAYLPLRPDAAGLLGLTAALIALAVFAKLAAGWAARGPGLNRLAIGVGMIPRGEVGLIFAGLGLSSGVLDKPLFAALVGMVVATTLVAPPLLKRTLT